ncbi:MAG: phospholipase [Bacteroidota bacterium]|nr:phospholipase [Bacteroidota bacterium]
MPFQKSVSSKKYNSNNRVELLRSGSEYFSRLLQLIHSAKEIIHIQVYIFSDDETGRMIADALKEAANRKVAVFLLADGYASQSLSKSFIQELKSAGIRFRFFEPVFRSMHFYFGRRLHQKVIVVDLKYALVGGMNIADRYNDIHHIPAWLDFALYVEGEIVQELCTLCWKTWGRFALNLGPTLCIGSPVTFNIPEAEQCDVRMRRNDWVRRKNEISSTYVEMLRTAQSQVTILSSYFLPGKLIRKQMVLALKRGVSIRVIAAGTSDVMMAKYAERWLYDWLLRKGIELYEYQKNVLHGKIAVCDDAWATIGSYNVNNISAYASIELNLDVRNAAFSTHVRNSLEAIMVNDCIRITQEHHVKTNNIIKQFVRWLSYHFIRIVFYLFTFYFKRQHH